MMKLPALSGFARAWDALVTTAKSKHPAQTEESRAAAEINLSNLRHNLNEIRKLIPEWCDVMAVVKADAYGHGAVRIAKCLQSCGVSSFAAADVQEAVSLRKSGIRGEILILGYTPAILKDRLIRYRLTQTIVSGEHADALCETEGTVAAHVKLDTGMNRLGIKSGELARLLSVYSQKRLRITGTFSHLARADSLTLEDIRFTMQQIANFQETVDILKRLGIDPGRTHIQSSYGILNYPGLNCDFVRPGIALFGELSHDAPTVLKPQLRPVMSLRSQVSLVKKVKAGETVGYGQAYTAPRDGKIAVVGIGYADGLPRSLSGKGCGVLIRGQAATMAGNVCMDQMMVDITGCADIRQGDAVTLIGADGGKELSVNQLSSLAGTINNDIFSRIGTRVRKIYRS